MKRTIRKEETATERLLRIIFTYPDKDFSLSELAEKAKVSKSSTSRLIRELQRAKIIVLRERRGIFDIQANTGSFAYAKKKIAFNLNQIYESNLIEFLDDYFRRPEAIILVGSYRSGEDDSTSDIDIAITSSKVETLRLKELKRAEKSFGRKIQIHLFNKDVDRNFFQSIVNGIVLSGNLEI